MIASRKKKYFGRYFLLDRSFYILYIVQLLQNVIVTAFLLIFNILLIKLGYSDAEAGILTSLRYLGVFCLSLPVGIWMKGRRLKPFFIIGALSVPVFSLAMIWFLDYKNDYLNYVLSFIWGCCTIMLQVTILPFIMRNSGAKLQTDAIAFMYTNFSVSQILAGACIIFGRTWLELDEKQILLSLSIFGLLFGVLIFFLREKKSEMGEDDKIHSFQELKQKYDWKELIYLMIPNTFLTVGAGLTIPYMNLFFFQKFNLDSQDFALLSSITALLVIAGTLIVPNIKRKYGYNASITITQVIAVIFLYLMAVTDLYTYAESKIVLICALLFFAFRQPFMQIAVPMTRSLMMNYTRKRNHEMVSAMISSLRSSSYFFSGLFFSVLRDYNFTYFTIFSITATFYALGVYGYHRMIVNYYESRGKKIIYSQ